MQKENLREHMIENKINSLSPGMWVALGLRENVAPLRSYIGQIQSVDDRGVRITLVDFFTGMASSWDFFVTWQNITSALVATSDHAVQHFGDAAEKFQSSMIKLGEKNGTSKSLTNRHEH